MRSIATKCAAAVVLATLTLGPARSSAQVDPTQLDQVRAALPTASPAKASEQRTLLVFTLTKGYRHSSIPLGAQAIRLMGERTGAYKAVISDDPNLFSPEKIKQFDAICFLSTTGTLFEETDLRDSLLNFVRGGGGVVGIHAATDCFYDWPDFGAMMGGYFDGHPWSAGDTVTVKVERPGDPLCKPFDATTFSITDEIYQLKAPYSRDRLRVLLSLDIEKTDITKRGIKRVDGDFAVSWVRSFGEGRVFYCSLGHREDIYWNRAVLGHYLAGIQFALGDLPVDTTPSGRITNLGWVDLLADTSLSGFTMKDGGWIVEDGVLTRKAGGYIWTKDRYADFILDLDFLIQAKGNSGVFFRTDDINDCVQTGIEMQVYDTHGKTEIGRSDCGAIYDCVAPRVQAVRKPGEWNRARIVCDRNRIRVFLNGEEIVDMDLDRWGTPHANPDGSKNKFRIAYKDMVRDGHIGFQDHGDPVRYRNVRIKRIVR